MTYPVDDPHGFLPALHVAVISVPTLGISCDRRVQFIRRHRVNGSGRDDGGGDSPDGLSDLVSRAWS